jgi:hypothetical protein
MWPGELVHRSVRESELLQHKTTSPIEEGVLTSKKIMVSLGNASLLRRYYEKVFDNLQQTNCRILAKVYVRLVEPRKQVKYPYNGRKTVSGITKQWSPDETKPPWWPSEVRHREPDHLHKVGKYSSLSPCCDKTKIFHQSESNFSSISFANYAPATESQRGD